MVTATFDLRNDDLPNKLVVHVTFAVAANEIQYKCSG